jgi:hypothetical protein
MTQSNMPGPIPGFQSLWPFINQGTALGPDFVKRATAGYSALPDPVAIRRSLVWRAAFAWWSLFWLMLWSAATLYGLVTAQIGNVVFAGALAMLSLYIFVRSVRGIKRLWAASLRGRSGA